MLDGCAGRVLAADSARPAFDGNRTTGRISGRTCRRNGLTARAAARRARRAPETTVQGLNNNNSRLAQQ